MSGKGDKYRDVDKKKFDAEYDRIFGKKKFNIMKESNDSMGKPDKRRKNKADKSSVVKRRQGS